MLGQESNYIWCLCSSATQFAVNSKDKTHRIAIADISTVILRGLHTLTPLTLMP